MSSNTRVHSPALNAPGPGFSPRKPASTSAGVIFTPASARRSTAKPKVCGMQFESENTEDRIHKLCARLALAEDPDEIDEIASQLRAELRERIANIGAMLALHHRLRA